jgi:hypothetical protein
MRRSNPNRSWSRGLCRGLLLALLCLSVAPRAFAQSAPEKPPDPERERKRHSTPRALTRRGRVLLGGSVGATWSSDTTNGYAATKTWSVYASPSATYFVQNHIGIGLNVGGGASRTRYSERFGGLDYRDRDVLAGLSMLFDIPLGKRLSLAFQPVVSYMRQWRRPRGEPLLELGYVRVAMNTPFLIHLAPDIAIGFGPDVWFDINTSFSLASNQPQPQQQFGFVEGSQPDDIRITVGLSATMLFAL